MPVTVRNAYVFEGRGKGWRETYFTNPTSDSLSDALTAWQATAPKRAALLGAEYTLKAVECSIEIDAGGNPVLGDSVVNYVSLPGTTTEPGADVDICVLKRMQSQNRTRFRNVFLGGIWDSVEANGGQYVPNAPAAPWQTFMNNFNAAIFALGAGWIASTKGPKYPIVSAVQNADDHIDITFGPIGATAGPFGAGPYPPRTKVRINTAKVKSRLSGETIVKVNTISTCTTIDKMAIFEGPTVGWYGFVHTNGFLPAFFFESLKIGRRKRGRPLLVTPGRAAAAPLG